MKALLCVPCLCYLVGLAAPSHFRGGIIQWRPVNSRAFDGEVSFYAITTLLETLTLCWRYVVGLLLAIFILLVQGSIYILKYSEDKMVLLKACQIRSVSGQVLKPWPNNSCWNVMAVGKLGKVCMHIKLDDRKTCNKFNIASSDSERNCTFLGLACAISHQRTRRQTVYQWLLFANNRGSSKTNRLYLQFLTFVELKCVSKNTCYFRTNEVHTDRQWSVDRAHWELCSDV